MANSLLFVSSSKYLLLIFWIPKNKSSILFILNKFLEKLKKTNEIIKIIKTFFENFLYKKKLEKITKINVAKR